jgi:hypothetical protein
MFRIFLIRSKAVAYSHTPKQLQTILFPIIINTVTHVFIYFYKVDIQSRVLERKETKGLIELQPIVFFSSF